MNAFPPPLPTLNHRHLPLHTPRAQSCRKLPSCLSLLPLWRCRCSSHPPRSGIWVQTQFYPFRVEGLVVLFCFLGENGYIPCLCRQGPYFLGREFCTDHNVYWYCCLAAFPLSKTKDDKVFGERQWDVDLKALSVGLAADGETRTACLHCRFNVKTALCSGLYMYKKK